MRALVMMLRLLSGSFRAFFFFARRHKRCPRFAFQTSREQLQQADEVNSLLLVERRHQPVVGMFSGFLGLYEQSQSGVSQGDGQIAAV